MGLPRFHALDALHVTVLSARSMRPATALLLVLASWFTLLMSVHCVTPDTFFCLVLGRSIVADGLPETNVLTVMNAGSAWIDQQWLAHWLLFNVMQLGGFPALLALRLALTLSSCGLALSYGARREVSPISLLLAGALGLALVLFKAKIRAQMLAEPLFVALCILLANGTRRGFSNRERALILGLLVVWANVHGSVLLALVLVWLATGLRVVYVARERGLELSRVLREVETRQNVVLSALALPAVFVSPYGLDLPRYYASTLGNPLFQQYLAEWQTTGWGQGSFMIVIGVGVTALLAVSRHQLRSFEWVVLASMLALSLYTVRYTLFFGLVLLCFGSLLIDRHLSRTARLRLEGSSLTVVSWFLGIPAALFGALVLSAYSDALASDWPKDTSARVSEAAGREGHVFAVVSFADRLLWERPDLLGRIAFDARFELLQREHFEAIQNVYQNPNHLLLRPYEVFVLEVVGDSRKFESAGFERIVGDHQAVVYRRMHAQVSRGRLLAD